MSKVRNNSYAMALVAGLTCLLVYLRALTCGFVNLDDPEYVLNNAAIRHLDWNLVVTAFTGACSLAFGVVLVLVLLPVLLLVLLP